MTVDRTMRGRQVVRRLACTWTGHQWVRGTVIQRLGSSPTLRATVSRCARCGRMRRTIEDAS